METYEEKSNDSSDYYRSIDRLRIRRGDHFDCSRSTTTESGD